MKNNIGNYFDNLLYEDLTDDLKSLADHIGMEHTRIFVKLFRATRFSVPSRPGGDYCRRYMCATYNGRNRIKIMNHLGISYGCYYKKLKEYKLNSKSFPDGKREFRP